MAKNYVWTLVDSPPKNSPFYGRLSLTTATPSKASSEPPPEKSSEAARDEDSEDSES